MHRPIRPYRARRRTTVAELLALIGLTVQRLRAPHRQSRQVQDTHLALQTLDPYTLRALGLERCDLRR